MKIRGKSSARAYGVAATFLWQTLLCVGLNALLVTQSPAEEIEYLLQPGDELSLTLLGVTPSTHVAIIGMDGQIGFPYVGTVRAEGLTLEELRREVGRAAVGTEVPSRGGGDQPFSILTENSLFLEVSRFRPVMVTGQVAAPGSVDFVPGMTVRAAIGAAGGIGIAQGGPMLPLDAPAQLRAAMETRQIIQGQLLQNEILLQEPASFADVSANDLAAFADILGNEAAADAIEEIEIAINERIRDREALLARIELVEQRIETLRAAVENYTEASDAEEGRLARVLEMSDRGLATTEMVNNARLAALAASTRLLSIEGDIFDTQAERERLLAEFEGLQDTYRANLLLQNRDLDLELAQITGRIQGLQAVMLGSGGGSAVASEMDTTVEVFIYRGSGVTEETFPATMSERVQPGDIIEVRVTVE